MMIYDDYQQQDFDPFMSDPMRLDPPQRPPFMPAPGSGAGSQFPPGPPPLFAPTQPPITPFRLDPRAISRCLFRYTYIWTTSGRSFWAWLTFVGRNSIAGFRWTGFGWTYFALSLNSIAYIECF